MGEHAGEVTSWKDELLSCSALMFLDGVFPGDDGELVNPSEAWGMCPLKAKNLSGVDLLLTLPQVSTNLHPPMTLSGDDS